MKNSVEYLSKEMDDIACIKISKWRWFLLEKISKLLNVRENYPFRWRYKNKNLSLKKNDINDYFEYIYYLNLCLIQLTASVENLPKRLAVNSTT